MASKRQREIFREEKMRALRGLLTALDEGGTELNEGGIPDTGSISLCSGKIIERLKDHT